MSRLSMNDMETGMNQEMNEKWWESEREKAFDEKGADDQIRKILLQPTLQIPPEKFI